MTAPIIENVSLDKASYSPGDTAVLTFDAYDPDARELTITVTVADSGNQVSQTTIPLSITDPVTSTVLDSDGRTWTRTSLTGVTQTWEATV